MGRVFGSRSRLMSHYCTFVFGSRLPNRIIVARMSWLSESSASIAREQHGAAHSSAAAPNPGGFCFATVISFTATSSDRDYTNQTGHCPPGPEGPIDPKPSSDQPACRLCLFRVPPRCSSLPSGAHGSSLPTNGSRTNPRWGHSA
jgi:hypothetical protein